MKFPKLIFLFSVAILITLTYACKDDEGGDDGPTTEDCDNTRSYMSDVVPILNTTCAIDNCHKGPSGGSIGDYTTYADLKMQHDMNKLKIQIESGTMPPDNTAGPKELTTAEKNTLLCWIEDGALEN